MLLYIFSSIYLIKECFCFFYTLDIIEFEFGKKVHLIDVVVPFLDFN